jgi:hypothetical protein
MKMEESCSLKINIVSLCSFTFDEMKKKTGRVKVA